MNGSNVVDTELLLEVEQEDDGRWIAEVTDLPGVMAYGASRQEAILHAKELAIQVLADRLANKEI